MCKIWSHFILFACGFNLEVEIESELDQSKVMLFVQIMFLMLIPGVPAAIPEFLFLQEKNHFLKFHYLDGFTKKQ